MIGLTGGIASGKSKVSSFLKTNGALIIDADLVARKIVMPHTRIWEEIVNLWGKEVIYPDLKLNRSKLSSIVFSDKKELEKLNNITHREIKKIIKEKISQFAPDSFVVIDAALLIEIGLHEIVDEVWLLSVTREKQIERLIHRDIISISKAERILNSQMSLEEKMKYADLIIDNNFEWKKTEQFLNKLLSERKLGRGK